VFAEEQKRKITELMAEQQQQEGGVPKHVNLTRYRTIKQELYDQLTDEERHAYEAKAAEQNKATKALPERSENFKYVDSCLFSGKGNLPSRQKSRRHRQRSCESAQQPYRVGLGPIW